VAAHTPGLIPYPASYHRSCGKFHFTAATSIITGQGISTGDVNIFNDRLFTLYHFRLSASHPFNTKQAYLSLISDGSLPSEGYTLKVCRNKIEIRGNGAGIFYGLQTLLQLIEKNNKNELFIRCCIISDYPRFSWRGMHLDVSRHFFPKEFIRKYIDFLASYKMNVFHWHLTDDQGWRIEIRKYPNLTQIGAFRNGTLKGHAGDGRETYDTIRYGGFYTQKDIREIVSYALERHITIVPEIEMPGHAMAVLASYPQFACKGGPFEVSKSWGVFDDVLCPKEETVSFIKDVLSEVMEMFPGKYIHIGGDECPRVRWHNCPACQALMKTRGLKNESELQSYFISRIDSFVTSKGRSIIGWDEILEGGLAPKAAIMSWRGPEGGIEAAKQHHYVVMSPGSYCYFDYYQGNPTGEPLAIGGYTTVEKVYSYDPVPAELKTEEKKYILGAQANVWTEYISTQEHAEYMVFPRICALSEILWLSPEKKDYKNFKGRLLEHFQMLDSLKINYSKAIYEIKAEISPAKKGNGILYRLTPSFAHTRIHYTTDLSNPEISSPLSGRYIHINRNLTLKAAVFSQGRMKGNLLIQQFKVTKSTGKSILLTDEPDRLYNHGGAMTLVDGIIGKIPWNGKEWLGFSGKSLNATIDLGKTDTISKVTVDVLKAENSWIYLPELIQILVSIDGKDYRSLAIMKSEEIDQKGRTMEINFGKTPARYVRVAVINKGIIPAGLPGEGNKSWLFVDEISVE